MSLPSRARGPVLWAGLALAVAVPFAIAAVSPLHAYRSLPYIAASLSAVLSLGLLLVQPLLAAGWLPGLSPRIARRWHARLGALLAALVAVHVMGVWLASPPDAVDALLFRAPTAFSVWGVVAMWAVILTIPLVALRHTLRLRPATWAALHNALALVVVAGTVGHALMIEGTMGTVSKWALCLAVLGATCAALARMRMPGVWRRLRLGRSAA